MATTEQGLDAVFPTDPRVQFNDGMSLQDYFAAKAMQSVLAGSLAPTDFGYSLKSGLTIMENCAAFSYEMANVMLKARNSP